ARQQTHGVGAQAQAGTLTVLDGLYWREAAKEPERDRKDLAGSQPLPATEDEHAHPSHSGIAKDGHRKVSRVVTAVPDELAPRKDQKQEDRGPCIEPGLGERWRAAREQRISSIAAFDQPRKIVPGIDQGPDVAEQGGREGKADPADHPDHRRRDVLERAL